MTTLTCQVEGITDIRKSSSLHARICRQYTQPISISNVNRFIGVLLALLTSMFFGLCHTADHVATGNNQTKLERPSLNTVSVFRDD